MFYWSILARIFNQLHPEFRFTKRGSKSYSWNMNASDEINTLLNYGYAVLESKIRKCVCLIDRIMSERFDPAPFYNTCRFCDYWSICDSKEIEE